MPWWAECKAFRTSEYRELGAAIQESYTIASFTNTGQIGAHIPISPWVAVSASCVVSEHIQASRCVADRPLAVLTGLAEPNPLTRSGKTNMHGGRYLSQTNYELLNLGALEVSFVDKMFYL